MLTHGPHMNADAFMQWAREQRLDSKREALERKREARRKALERRHKYSKDVAGALSVVAALIASALLTVLLGPSPLVLDHGSWDPSDSTSPIMNPTPGSNSTTIVVINTGATSGIDVACYSTCWAWRRAYGVAASVSFQNCPPQAKRSRTAVTAAARAGFVEVVRALRIVGRCDPTARNQAGQTPLEIAQEDFPDVEKELLTWEAEWKKQLSSGGAGRGDSAGSVSAGSASGPGQGRVSSADGDSMRSGSGAGAGTAPPATGE